MRRRIIIAVLGALLMLPITLAAVLFYTETGVRLIASQLWRLERFGIHIEAVSGTLSGPLRVGHFSLDHPRVEVTAHEIVIDPQLRGLLLQTVQAGAVRASDVQVVIRRSELPPSGRPPRFLPQFMRIDARNIELTRVRYVHLNGTAVEAERVRGEVTIGARNLRVRRFAVEARQFDATGDLRLRADRPFGLRGSARGHVRTGLGMPLTLETQVDGTLDRLAMKARMGEPYVAAADGLLTRDRGDWKIEGHISSPSFGLQPWLERPPFSLRNVALNVKMTRDGIGVSGNVGIPEFDRSDMVVAARGRFAGRVLALDQADLALTGTPAVLHASGTITFDGQSPTLELAGNWRNLQWPLHGRAVVVSAAGAAELHGPLPYTFTATAQVEGPRIPAARGTVRGVLARDQAMVDEYLINTLGGSLSGEAKLQFAQPHTWSIATRASDIDPGGLHEEFPGDMDLAAQAHGTGFGRDANFTVELGDLRGALRSQRVRATGSVQRQGRNWRVRSLSASLAGARIKLDGAWGDTLDARWSLHAPDIERLLPQAAGRIDFSGTVSGPRKAPHLIAKLDASGLRYEGWVAQRVSVSADIDARSTQQSRLSMQASRVGRGGSLIDSIGISGDGTAAQHRVDLEVSGPVAEGNRAPAHASLRIDGQYVQQIWNATITDARVSTGGASPPMSLSEPAKVAISRKSLSLDDPFCLVIGAGHVCAQGAWQRGGSWQATLSGREIPVASLLPMHGEAAVSGRVEGRVHAFGAPGLPWQGEAGMRIVDAAISYRPVGAEPETLTLGTGGLAAKATAERVDFSFGIQAFTDTFIYANAQLLRDGGNALTTLPLSGSLRAQVADANILPLVIADIDNAAGLLTANASVLGTIAQPEITGRIELKNGELDSYRVNLALREIGATADFESDGLTFRGHARAGEGRLAADGRFTWRGGKPNGNLRLSGQNLLVADLPEYRVVASPDMRFLISGERMDVSGDVAIPSARIQPVQLTGAVKASEDARYVGEHAAEQAGRFVVNSQVRVAMGDDVRVDAFGLQGRVLGAVTTTVRTREPPTGRGELSVTDGRYEAYGQKLEINRGRLLFEASPLDDPGLDIEARRRIEAVTVGLNVRGTLQQPRLTFFSEPSLPQTQIVSYLLTGKSIDTTAGSDTATISGARETLALQGGGLLASQLGRRIGIEELGVESSVTSAGEANTALVLGKFLSPRLFISYGISLTESINTLKLRYTISDRWILRTEAGENQSADIEYTIER